MSGIKSGGLFTIPGSDIFIRVIPVYVGEQYVKARLQYFNKCYGFLIAREKRKIYYEKTKHWISFDLKEASWKMNYY